MEFPQTLQLVHPIASDALFLFETREFFAQNPNSLTATLMRILFEEDLKGVLVVLYNSKEVDILAISDANYERLRQFQSETVRVLQAEKSAGQNVPAGFSEVLDRMSACQTIEYADSVESNLTKTIDEKFGNRVVGKASILPELYIIPDSLFPGVKAAVSEAEKGYMQLAEMLCKRAPRLSTERITQQLEAIEKSQEFSMYQAQSYAFSITTTIQEGILQRGINSLRTGFSNVSEMRDQKFQAIQITASSRGSLELTIGRMIFICKEENKKELEEKLDDVTKLHEQSIACIRDQVSVSQIFERIEALHSSSGLKIVDKLTGMSIAGYSQSGICCKAELSSQNVDMCLKRDDQRELFAGTPVVYRTSVLLDLSGNEFVCTFCDSVMPSASEIVSSKSLTSPIGTKSSVSEFLREYYVVKAVESTQKQEQASFETNGQQMQDSLRQSSTLNASSRPSKGASERNTSEVFITTMNSSSEEPSKELDILAKRRANQAKKRMLLDRHAELREEVIQQMQRRLITEKLICDDEDAQEIKIAYREVEDMPHNIQQNKNVFIPGDNIFIYINGRPVPFLTNFFHSAQASGEDKRLIKIRFIAPGQIAGRKELHYELEQYKDYSYIKEITLETQNYAVASRIAERLEKIKALADGARKTEAADIYQFPEFDCDNLLEPMTKQFLIQEEAYRPLRNTEFECEVGSSTISQALEMRPKLKMVESTTGRRDEGDLAICENGIKYRYAATGEAAVELFMPFRQIRRIYYEKFRDNEHVCVVSFMFYKPVRVEDCLVDSSAAKLLQRDANYYERFTFLCSMETQLELGMGRERDEMLQEQETRAQMKKANIRFEEFFSKLDEQVSEWCKEAVLESESSLNMDREPLENPRPLVCQVSKRSRALGFLGSVEQKGEQSVYSYDPGSIGVFNGKVERSIDLEDVQIAVFENVNYSTHNAFQIAFVFKDIRVEPYIIREIQFDNITDIQEFLTLNSVYYVEINDSFMWAEARKRFNANREEYEQFVEQGGWIYELGDIEDSSSQSIQSEDAYTESSDGYGEASDSYSKSSVVASESVKESEGDYSVYDWSRSDS